MRKQVQVMGALAGSVAVIAVVHLMLGISRYYRESVVGGYWATVLAAMVAALCVVFLMQIIVFAFRYSKGTEASDVVLLGTIRPATRLIISDNCTSQGAFEVSLAHPARCATQCFRRGMVGAKEIWKITVLCDGASNARSSRLGEIVIDSGTLTVSAFDSPAELVRLQQAKPGDVLRDEDSSSSARLLLLDDEVVAIEVAPPYGDGQYSLFLLIDGDAVAGVECRFVEEESAPGA